MEKSDLIAEEYASQIKKYQGFYNSLLFLAKSEQWDFTAAILEKTLKRLTALLAQIRGESEEIKLYMDMVIKRDIPSLEADAARASELNQKHGHDLENAAEEITGIIYRTGKAITVLKKEILVAFHLPSAYKRFVHAYRIQIGLLFVFLVLIPVGSFTAYYLKTKSSGLKGDYFAGMNFNFLVQSRIDPEINFDWKSNSPLKKLKENDFSIRWQGFIYIPVGGEYEFFTVSDDGVKLFLDENIVIDHWSTHYAALDSAKLKLAEGYYPIRLEYFEKAKFATIKLYWKYESDSDRTIIPKENLLPSEKYLRKDIKRQKV